MPCGIPRPQWVKESSFLDKGLLMASSLSCWKNVLVLCVWLATIACFCLISIARGGIGSKQGEIRPYMVRQLGTPGLAVSTTARTHINYSVEVDMGHRETGEIFVCLTLLLQFWSSSGKHFARLWQIKLQNSLFSYFLQRIAGIGQTIIEFRALMIKIIPCEFIYLSMIWASLQKRWRFMGIGIPIINHRRCEEFGLVWFVLGMNPYTSQMVSYSVQF